MEIPKLIKSEIIGINKKCSNVNKGKSTRTRFNTKLKIPIKNDEINDKNKVANTFSPHDRKSNSPRIKSLLVRAQNGLVIFPLNERIAGIIKIRMGKLLNGKIKIVNITPAERDPMIDITSEGKVSLNI